MESKEHIQIRWMGGAGFWFEYNEMCIGLDLYISNHCMNKKGEFKRITPPPCKANEIYMDYLISSHEHGDHLDTGSLEEWFKINGNLKLIGTDSALNAAEKFVPRNKMLALNRGGRIKLAQDIILEGIFCDHGDQSPDAMGVILKFGGLSVYFMSDMQFREDLLEVTGARDIDVLIVPINPAFGNPGTDGAAKMTTMIAPKKAVIPCHFWLFKEHGDGDPGSFEKACAAITPQTKCVTLAVGEKFVI